MVRNEQKAFPSTEVSLPGKHLPEKLVCDTYYECKYSETFYGVTREMSWEMLEDCGLSLYQVKKES